MSRFYVWYPDSGSEFLRNIFEDSAGLSIGVIGNLIIENNAFVRPSTTYAIENWANYGRGLRLMNNSFLDGSTVELRDGYDNTFIDAGSNYWGTTKECRIEDRIKDRNDSLTYASAINYQPILSEQHADTPISDGALDLDANCPTPTTVIVLEDTTWSSQSQVLSGEVQIADSITLTISPGLSVEDTNFFVQGVLIVDGDPGAPVSLTNTTVSLSDNSSYPGKLDIEYAVIEGGTVPAMGHGLFSIRDSHFKNMSRFYVWYPDSGSEFLRNIFEDSAGLSIGVIGNLIIENNAFVRPSTTYAIENWANYGRGLRLMNNSFLDGSTVELRDGYDNTFIDAGSNYWGTTKECRIEDRIKDRNDSLTYASAINYQPILSEQHADTPISDGALDSHTSCVCSKTSYDLNSQAEVDALGETGCSIVNGSLRISGSSDTTNLNALASLTNVSGNLEITKNIVLSNCQGVASLLGWPSGPPDDSVGGAITVEANATGCNSVAEVLAVGPLQLPTAPAISSTDYEDSKIILTVSVTDNGGADITGYEATCTDGTDTFTGTSTSSPITVSGLTNEVAYTCTVTATNSVGTSSASAATTPITPEATATGLPIWLLYQATQ